jgi:hypothetical protein
MVTAFIGEIENVALTLATTFTLELEEMKNYEYFRLLVMAVNTIIYHISVWK